MTFRGTAWRLGDHIDTDVIIPARYLVTADPRALAPHCFEDLDPTLAGRIQPGDLIVAGENFGQGSSREHAPIAIKGLGVACVIAKSYARIFFRNAFNIGLPLLECRDLPEVTASGDVLVVDNETGRIVNETRGTTHQAAPLPEFMRRLVEAGGIIEYVRRQVAEGRVRR
ncbi:MAG: 3-isopropylmalate dehydratase small subunit [Armatimonadota bacterium]|nr:3-isopropylmalate dehydratase small subunit [Armatimonadota bacterium]MDR7532653.1 3-isopropylmalate dehydratase small subunit [Armatimonadota bacterium]MDR7536304.1 3-isopropylmalate dehydratase small subunit [Armatimonadota bacterium]